MYTLCFYVDYFIAQPAKKLGIACTFQSTWERLRIIWRWYGYLVCKRSTKTWYVFCNLLYTLRIECSILQNHCSILLTTFIFIYIIPCTIGPVFGNIDFFHGLAIFLDTYSNHNGPHNVSIYIYYYIICCITGIVQNTTVHFK